MRILVTALSSVVLPVVAAVCQYQ